jgi:hypothetical protein
MLSLQTHDPQATTLAVNSANEDGQFQSKILPGNLKADMNRNCDNLA